MAWSTAGLPVTADGYNLEQELDRVAKLLGSA
jgi:hypothetical protein